MGRKILIIRFSSIGDIVLTTPVIRTLYKQLGAEVHFLTSAAFAPILQFNPNITKVITAVDNFEAMILALKREKYDLVIDLHHNVRTQRIKLTLGIPSTSFYKLNVQKWLLVWFGINRLPQTHIVDRYMATTANLGLHKDREGLDFFIPADKEIDIGSTFGFTVGSYIAIVIGAAHQTKCMTAQQITKLCNRIKKPVILLGGKNELIKANYILENTDAVDIRNACGGFDLLQSASILRQAGAVITHDTGLMHIAAALKKPLVVVWGNTIPQFGMYPYYGDEKVSWISFERSELKCRPCSKLGFSKCPKGHFKCILDHDMNEIAEAAKTLFTFKEA